MNYRLNSLNKLCDRPELEAAYDDLGWTVAHDCARSGDVALLSSQLQLNPRLIQLRDCWGATALHWAANFASIEAISVLLAAGADVNAVCTSGESALFWAFRSGSVACCRAIIDAGADLQIQDTAGKNVLMCCAMIRNFREEIAELLIYSGVDLEAQDVDGDTAVMLASGSGSPETLRMLLDAGASIDAQDHLGRSALCHAICQNRQDNLQLLMERGASLHILDNRRDSILFYAALCADIDTMSILEEARIEGLPMDRNSVNDYWYYFGARDKYFIGHRASLEDEEEAFQALLDSVIPSSGPPPLIAIKSFDIPGAFPVEPINERDAPATPEGEDSSDGDDTVDD
jgi:ankyrin repeat protein